MVQKVDSFDCSSCFIQHINYGAQLNNGPKVLLDLQSFFKKSKLLQLLKRYKYLYLVLKYVDSEQHIYSFIPLLSIYCPLLERRYLRLNIFSLLIQQLHSIITWIFWKLFLHADKKQIKIKKIKADLQKLKELREKERSKYHQKKRKAKKKSSW